MIWQTFSLLFLKGIFTNQQNNSAADLEQRKRHGWGLNIGKRPSTTGLIGIWPQRGDVPWVNLCMIPGQFMKQLTVACVWTIIHDSQGISTCLASTNGCYRLIVVGSIVSTVGNAGIERLEFELCLRLSEQRWWCKPGCWFLLGTYPTCKPFGSSPMVWLSSFNCC